MSKLVSTNPSDNYSFIGEVETTSDKEIELKVSLARKALDEWRNIGLDKRLKLLQEVYNALQARRKDISKLACQEMGFPITQQEMFDLGDGFDYFEWYLKNTKKYLKPEVTFENKKEIHKVYHEPIGVAAVIQPWNFPFCQWSWSVVPNLLVGNTVVFKHSEEVPLTGKLIEDIITSSNLPKGVFNEIYGDGKVGKFLIDQDIDLVSFTGSNKVGQAIYKKAATKFIKVLLELGGSAPGIIFKDADITTTLEHVFDLRYTNNGQACDGLKRLIVHESKFNEVVEGLKQILKTKTIGNPLDPKTDFGPLVTKKQQDLIASQVKDAKQKGAKVIIGGEVPNKQKGAFYNPTILTNISTNMRVWKEEVFGPVLPVVSFKTDEEATRLANDTTYGLGSYIYTKDVKKAEKIGKTLKTGMVSINGVNYVCPFNPFGGYKESGMGREHGRYGLHDLCQIKVIALYK